MTDRPEPAAPSPATSTGSAPVPLADAADRAAAMDCLRCGSRITLVGEQALRAGGKTGAAAFFLGQWAELDEEHLRVVIFVCPSCRHIELRAPQP